MQRLGDGSGIVSRTGAFDAGLDDFHSRIGVHRESFSRDVLRLQGLDSVLGSRVLRGILGVGEERTLCVCAADCPIFGVGEAFAAEHQGLHASIVELARQETAFSMVAAEIDHFSTGRLQLGDERGKILVARCDRIIMDFGDAALVDGRLERIGKTLAISALVVDHGNLLVLHVFLGRNQP